MKYIILIAMSVVFALGLSSVASAHPEIPAALKHLVHQVMQSR